MKALLTGAGGMLGRDITEIFGKNFDVFSVQRKDLDITDSGAVMKMMMDLKPDIVINCAAFTKVDECETENDMAFEINGYGAGNVATACEEIGARLVHISTDYVFDGRKGTPYIESDPTNPLNIYGKSKLLGEEKVRGICAKHYIIRTQWLYGKNGDNFIKTMLGLAEAGGRIAVVNDQYGSPTYTADLAEAIYCLAKCADYGTFHITNAGVCSWYDFAFEVFRLTGICADIVPCCSEQFPRPAKRPAYSALDNSRYILSGNKPPKSWKKALESYLEVSGK